MTPTTPPTPPGKPTPARPDNSKQRLIAIAAIVIVALLAVNAWLLFKYTESNKEQAVMSTQLDESAKLQEELNDKYYAAKTELESMSTGNAELTALIEQQKAELKESKDRIASLIRKGGNMDAARAEIAQLNEKVASYLAELNQLREQNALLADENNQLTTERNDLRTNLDMQLEANSNLNQERAMLVSDREQLTQTNSTLSQKVTKAATIKVAALEAVGQKIRRSGKPVTRNDAGSVEQLAITFKTTVNEIAERGDETFFVRIVNPQGETLALDQMGSGAFKNLATGENMRYTLKDDISYDRQENILRLLWAPGQQFAEGKYQVEVYNKGFLAGATSLVLK
ncbi:MAG: hypothetical protein DA408_19920 [Bacteroidetes bacterium]|nr:MAG: hypothetical protein C7N36_18485 [Bacteroidota bacterium]PTM08746.1 MAG: hypothetical protein DA408_19920 [Bacteroidota bacterium]